MKYLKRFEAVELSGKHSFFNFLQVIGNHDYHFIYSEAYTKSYDYLYFYVTSTLKNNQEFTDVFQYKKSLSSVNDVLKKLGTNRVTFFFGINKNKILRYGVLDSNSKKSYVCGEFKVNDKYFNSVKKYKALEFANRQLNDINIKNISLIRQIEEEFKTFYKSKKIHNIKIEGKDTIKAYISKNKFTDDDMQTNRPFRVLHEWIQTKKWSTKVHYYVDEDNDKYLEFIIIVN